MLVDPSSILEREGSIAPSLRDQPLVLSDDLVRQLRHAPMAGILLEIERIGAALHLRNAPYTSRRSAKSGGKTA